MSLSNVRPIASHELMIELPPESYVALARFLSERVSGNVMLNVKDGKILGAKIEHHCN